MSTLLPALLPMLIPLNRSRFEQLIPTIATGNQYKYCWGTFSDLLRRLLASIIGALVILFSRISAFGESLELLLFLVGITAGTYWLWGPILWASQRNVKYRKFPYSGFWRGRVLDVFVTDELVSTEETVNNQGDLVIVENRERRLNLDLGDKTGFETRVQVPIRRQYRSIDVGMAAEMIVLSDRPDLSRINRISDVYLPEIRLWVSDYPYLQRDIFLEVSETLRRQSMRADSEAMDRRSSRRERDRR
ncbi:hypothetical protein [Roseofilum casamattae]|uniref:Phosphate ABC transporter permease n=1 Tax=Roseofilum casamattae BLCC-M143 TaxID=3022442 RepID=A0ABT7C027_9CYAN|nr:hypothetical protein [Roseofilum casamattae]MDJ1184818.1 phosphate ABC transporter permease [Roseofilum casamattae BLCC-M143]